MVAEGLAATWQAEPDTISQIRDLAVDGFGNAVVAGASPAGHAGRLCPWMDRAAP